MKGTFFVRGSDGDSFYSVDVRLSNGALTIQCNCAAGRHDQACKHKAAVLSGDESSIDDERDIKPLRKFAKMMEGSGSLRNYQLYIDRIKELEDHKIDLDKKLKSLKGEFGRKMRDGI